MRPSIILCAALPCALLSLSALAAEPARPAPPRLVRLGAERVSLRDALAALEQVSSLRVRPLWKDDRHEDGLDPDQIISNHCRGASPMQALESLLRQAGPTATWQPGDAGEIEIGPRSRLNERRITRIYPVHDLLKTVPDYRDIPTIDLSAALQRSGTSPLRDETHSPASEDQDKPDPAKELIALIITTVEPDQCAQQGGPATIRLFQNSLVVTAPGYIHRQLDTNEP